MVFNNALNGFERTNKQRDNPLRIRGTTIIENDTYTAPELNEAISTSVKVPQTLQTGILTTEGGSTSLVVANTATSIDILGGTGQVVDRTDVLNGNITITNVTWPSETNVSITPLLPSPDGNFPIAKDINGDTVVIDAGGSSLLTSVQQMSHIQIGVLTVASGSITLLSIGAFAAYAVGGQFYPLSTTFGVMNSQAQPVTIEPSIANPSNLRFKVNEGEVHSTIAGFFFNPELPNSVIIDPAVDPQAAVVLALRDNSFSFSGTNEIDPTMYESPVGTLNTVGTNKFTLQRLYLFPGSRLIATLYGETDFTSLALAESAALVPPPKIALFASAIFIANLAIKKEATDFSQPGVEFSLFDVD